MSEQNDSTIYDRAWWAKLRRESASKHQQELANILVAHIDVAALGVKGKVQRLVIDWNKSENYDTRWYITTDVEIGRIDCKDGIYTYTVIDVEWIDVKQKTDRKHGSIYRLT